MTLHIRSAARTLSVRAALLFTVVFVMTVSILFTTSNEAEAHAPCSGGSHWHQHWPFHRDYWHDHGWVYAGGNWYRAYHIHQHNDWRHTYCP